MESGKLLPETRLLNPKSFRALIGEYDSVYVKPNMEHTGKGIMKVWKMGDSYRLVKINGEERKYELLMKEAGSKPHIVQKRYWPAWFHVGLYGPLERRRF